MKGEARTEGISVITSRLIPHDVSVVAPPALDGDGGAMSWLLVRVIVGVTVFQAPLPRT